jgi:GNAT superfamily N-acetyltransferase
MMAYGRTMREIKVRKFQESDVEDVLEIFASDGLIRNDEERERIRKGLMKNAKAPEWYDHFFVAEVDGRVVGRVILEAAYPPYSELINLYVLPDYQGMGVGSALVRSCIEKASANGSFLMSAMTDPAGNLPAYRLYSKFGFRPAILGDPSLKRGHMWLFRFSEECCVSEFLRRHPFAEPKVSHSKGNFHNRMLYQMSWKDPQTEERIDLYIEGQPSQISEGTMPRIAGLSCKEKDLELELLLKEENETIKQGQTSKFYFTLWNLGSRPVQSPLSTSIPDGTTLTPQSPSSVKVGAKEEKTIQFKFTWIPQSKLPDFTSFPTIIVTCYLNAESFEHPLFTSAGFRKEQPDS